MQLWSPEIEAMRPEARAVVAAGLAALMGSHVGQATSGDPVEQILQRRQLLARTFRPVPEAVEQDIGGVRCRTFRPDDGAPVPAIYVHFHGGGMAMGAPEMSDAENLELARRCGIAVVSVDYRKAPEHPFPAGPDDGVAVAAWLIEHGPAVYGTDRLVLGGESAGGYMTAIVALRIRDELGAADRLLGANIVFGVQDIAGTPSQRGMRPTAGPDMLNPEGCRTVCELFTPGLTNDERRDPAISPLYADLRGLCPALMSVGTDDHLFDDTVMFAPRWAAAGNDVEVFVAPDMPHGFGAFPCGISDAWRRVTDDWLRRVLLARSVDRQQR